MSDITNRNIAESMRLMAWERAKGELRGMLHTYWPCYYLDGNKVDEGFDAVDDKIRQFIQDIDDSLL